MGFLGEGMGTGEEENIKGSPKNTGTVNLCQPLHPFYQSYFGMFHAISVP